MQIGNCKLIIASVTGSLQFVLGFQFAFSNYQFAIAFLRRSEAMPSGAQP